ncbi:hypothetical protein CRUP_010334, partial [Coryphaenoides rupestris]
MEGRLKQTEVTSATQNQLLFHMLKGERRSSNPELDALLGNALQELGNISPENADDSSSDESAQSPSADGSSMTSDLMKLCGDNKTRSKARRRTTTQMELLYPNSDSAPDTPTDFSGPMLPLAETPEGGGGGELDLSGSSVRDYTALSPGFSSKMGSIGLGSGSRVLPGPERRGTEPSPLSRRKTYDKAQAASDRAKVKEIK